MDNTSRLGVGSLDLEATTARELPPTAARGSDGGRCRGGCCCCCCFHFPSAAAAATAPAVSFLRPAASSLLAKAQRQGQSGQSHGLQGWTRALRGPRRALSRSTLSALFPRITSRPGLAAGARVLRTCSPPLDQRNTANSASRYGPRRNCRCHCSADRPSQAADRRAAKLACLLFLPGAWAARSITACFQIICGRGCLSVRPSRARWCVAVPLPANGVVVGRQLSSSLAPLSSVAPGPRQQGSETPGGLLIRHTRAVPPLSPSRSRCRRRRARQGGARSDSQDIPDFPASAASGRQRGPREAASKRATHGVTWQ